MGDYDLKTILPRIRATPWNFGLYRGEDGDQLLFTAAPATKADLSKIEADCGKPRQILKGICYQEEGHLVFGMKIAPAPAWEKMISSVLQNRKCAQYLPISLRQLGADEKEEVDATDDPQAAQAKAEWEALKAALLPAVKAGLANPALKSQVTQAVTAASGHEKIGAYEQATATFTTLRRRLEPNAKPVPKPAAPVAAAPAAAPAAPAPAPVAPPPAAPAEPAASTGGDDLEDLIAALEGNG